MTFSRRANEWGAFALIARLAAVVLAVLGLAGCSGRRAAPVAHRGELDLRAWSFARDGAVELRGEWEYVGEELLDGHEPWDARGRYAFVPGSLGSATSRWGERHGGAGTYRLRVKLPDDIDPADGLRLFSGSCNAAFRYDVRDPSGAAIAPVLQAGVPGTSASTSRPSWATDSVVLLRAPPEIVVSLQLSDFWLRDGGVVIPPELGATRALHAEVVSKERTRDLTVGVIGVMAVYHFTLFALRRKEKSALFLALFCLSVAARTAVLSHVYGGHAIWPALAIRFEYLGWYGGALSFPLFFRSLFPAEVTRGQAHSMVAAFGALAVLFLVLPIDLAIRLQDTGRWLSLAGVGLTIFWLAKVVRQRRGDVVVMLIAAGTFVLTFSVVFDIIRGLGLHEGPWIANFGLCGFIVAQSSILAVLNQRARSRSEALAIELTENASQLADKARELDAKNLALAQVDRLKDEFLANTSHELRTPLNGIIGLAESLLDGAAGALSSAARRNLAMIASSGKRLASLVNDILDFSKLRHDTLRLEQRDVDATAVVDAVLALSQPLAAKKRLTLVNRMPRAGVLVFSDENRLQQIALNLVGNAIKFTSEGTVEVSCADAGDLVAISVTDTGIGIPEEALQRIFVSFEQGDGGSAREYGGTGLGLAITKELVELHGGTIHVTSRVGAGSTFTFTLPRSLSAPSSERPASSMGAPNVRMPSEAPAATIPPPSHAVQFRVLAVDDDPVNLAVLQNHLRSAGYAVTTTQDGAEALALAKRGPPYDAVLLDLMMPRITGFEVCRKLREDFPANELPIVLLTARTAIDDFTAGFDAGANDYLTKPFSKQELLARLATHISLAKKNIAYGRFVPREVLALLGKGDVVDVKLGDSVEKDLTCLFCDVRAFTARSEKLSPSEAFGFLNGYLGSVGPLIRAHGGFVDKFIGDAVMALFPRSPEDALRAAVDIQHELRRLNALRQANDADPITIAAGVHAGRMMLGTIGDSARMEATVIADAVNVAARIEGLAKDFGALVVTSESALAGAPNAATLLPRPLGLVAIRGRRQPLALVEILAAEHPDSRDARLRSLARFADAVATFQRGELASAGARFDAILADDEHDGAARLYAHECARLLASGRPADFQGAIRTGYR